MENKIKPICKCSLYKNSRAFGIGPMNLLKEIDRTGSIRKAAKNIDISYSKAHRIINNCSKELGFSLIKTEIGGKKGGGSILTDKCRKLILKYEEFTREIDNYAKSIEEEYFGEFF